MSERLIRYDKPISERELADPERFTSNDFKDRDMPGEYVRYGDFYRASTQLRNHIAQLESALREIVETIEDHHIGHKLRDLAAKARLKGLV